MTVKELTEALKLKAFYVEEEEREIETVYCGDLLSWVMGRCPADAAWITIMSNQNVAAVAVLCDTASFCPKMSSPMQSCWSGRKSRESRCWAVNWMSISSAGA